ncbi:unnamed protein product [Clavelina lepadiformis]|uniref:Uncharacterized protein n=1 Tax=Clavelina lepadiformis TaxID=159417 RepID=A0ABP0GX29_CLALP
MENLASNKSEPFTELVFLRQMVHRLNAALSKYQGADVLNVDEPNTVGLSTSADEASANWLTDPTLLSPLIHEYEIHLSTLITKISGLSAENKNCVYKVKVLTEENSRLHSELQEIVQQQIQDVQSSEFPAASDDSALKNLQAQLELVNREKDSAIEMNRETMKLLDKMRQERIVEVSHSRSRECIFNETKARNERLQESNLEMQIAIDTLQKDHQTLTLTATGQLNELRSLQEQLHKAKQVMAKDKCKTEELKAVQTLLNNKVQNLEQEKSELEQKLKIILTEKQNLQNFLIQAESKLAHTLQNVSDAQSQIDSLKIQVVALEKTNAELDGKEMSYLMQIREGAQLLDDALLARDSALVREKQKQEDLEKTSAALETIVQEVADRVKSEVGKIKAQCNERMRRLTEEVEALELEATNLKSEADRAKRAKRTVEEELDALSRQRHDKNDRSQTEDLQRRTLNAERARDDAFITIQASY